MSRANVEIVQRSVDQFNETGEPLWREIDPDVEWVIEPGAFLAGTYRGHDGFRTSLRLMAEVFDQVRAEVDELVDAGDSIVVLGGFRVRGPLSGATGGQRGGAAVFTLRDGRIVAYRAYLRREDALEALRLPE
jgi:ketosteroid isomerase-like protein